MSSRWEPTVCLMKTQLPHGRKIAAATGQATEKWVRYRLRVCPIGEASHTGALDSFNTFTRGGNFATGANWNATDAADEPMSA